MSCDAFSGARFDMVATSEVSVSVTSHDGASLRAAEPVLRQYGETDLREGERTIAPRRSNACSPAGTPVYMDKDGQLTAQGGKGARAAGVLLSAGNTPRVLLRGIVA